MRIPKLLPTLLGHAGSNGNATARSNATTARSWPGTLGDRPFRWRFQKPGRSFRRSGLSCFRRLRLFRLRRWWRLRNTHPFRGRRQKPRTFAELLRCRGRRSKSGPLPELLRSRWLRRGLRHFVKIPTMALAFAFPVPLGTGTILRALTGLGRLWDTRNPRPWAPQWLATKWRR